MRLEQPGRGRALRSVWSASDADVLAYMDVDLSTDLNALLPLVAPLLSGHSDLAIGTRLARGARVVRGPRREVISRCYNLLLHATLGAGFSDAQCGFKAIRADKARLLLPLTRDTGWFFDSELLVLAERAGLRIHEVPVDWIDDPDSRVKVAATALADLRGIARMRWGFLRGTLPGARLCRRGHAQAGAAAAAATGQVPRRRGGQHARLRPAVSRPAHGAAGAAGQRGQPAGHRRAQHRGQPPVHLRHPGTAGPGPAPGAGAARVRRRAGADLRRAGHAARGGARPARAAEVTVLVGANLAATVLRFLVYRHWVFRGHRPAPGPQPAGAPALPRRALPATLPAATVPSLDIEKNGHHR